MKVLVIGSGGREHALAWKVAQSQQVAEVFVTPGNAGSLLENKVQNIDIGINETARLVTFAEKRAVDLTIVGPELPLIAGVTDAFQKAGLAIFGPTKSAARLEGSKLFTKKFLIRHGIPTAAYASFERISCALNYLEKQTFPVVIKADGPAAGKGVFTVTTLNEAEDVIKRILTGRVEVFGSMSRRRIIIEDFLEGEETSFIAMVDGQNVLPMATSQDHKCVGDKDTGVNTGGMGAYSPASVVTPEINERILKEVIYPTVEGMAKEGHPYTGFLYAGLIIDDKGNIKVIEYNCRSGDPETQPIMMRMKSDLVKLCQAALKGQLDSVQSEWDPRVSVSIVLATEDYPKKFSKRKIISGLPQASIEGEKMFHSGTIKRNGDFLTNGGRVLCATALGKSVLEARKRAYALARKVSWEGLFFRSDIGHRAVTRERRRVP